MSNELNTQPEAQQQAEQAQPVAAAWAEGYRQGVADERTSEANIGIAGFNAKVEPARQNPYKNTAPPRQPTQDAIEIAGLTSAVGHLSAIVDEQRELLAEVDRVCGVDGHGGQLEDGESELIDKVRAHLAKIAPPPRQPLTDEQIKDVAASCMWWVREQDILEDAIELARAIEAAHGIKGEA